MCPAPNDSSTSNEEVMVFPLSPTRRLLVQIRLVESAPAAPGLPPRPPMTGDTALAVAVDHERMLLVQYGFEEIMQSTPVVSGSPPGNQN